jgi:hypothetical protein
MLGLLNIVYRPYLGSEPYFFYPAPVKKFWEKVRIGRMWVADQPLLPLTRTVACTER